MLYIPFVKTPVWGLSKAACATSKAGQKIFTTTEKQHDVSHEALASHTGENSPCLLSVSWLGLCSGAASSRVRSGQSRPPCLQPAPQQSHSPTPPASYLRGFSSSALPQGARGLTDEGTGSRVTTQPSCSALRHIFISKKCWFKYRPQLSLTDPQLQALQFGKQMLYHYMFSEGYIVYTSGCCLALCYKIFYFSFLLFSSAVFFFPWIY